MSATTVNSATLDVNADRCWTLTVDGESTVLHQPYDLHTALWVACEFFAEKHGIDVVWVRGGSPTDGVCRYVVHSWTGVSR